MSRTTVHWQVWQHDYMNPGTAVHISTETVYQDALRLCSLYPNRYIEHKIIKIEDIDEY